MKKKSILIITLSTFIYGNYKLLTRVSMTLFPFIAIYTIFINMDILLDSVTVGLCTYCLYFQEILAKWQMAPANGDEEKMKEIIRNDTIGTYTNFFCMVIGIICLYVAWFGFIKTLICG